MKPLFNAFALSPLEGAQTTLFCCLEPSIAGMSGAYFEKCAEKGAHKRALNVEDQDRLWELSEGFVGLKQ